MLGRNRQNPLHFTSIAKVAGQQARAFLEQGGALFASSEGVINQHLAHSWLKGRGWPEPGWVVPNRHWSLAARRERLWRVNLAACPPWRRLGVRVRKDLVRVAGRLPEREHRPLPPGREGEVRTWFSPLFPVPLAVEARQGIRRVVTIHDLVGLTRPELTLPYITRRHRAVVESLRPEDVALCISEATRQEFLSCRPGFDPSRARVALLGVEERFRPVEDTAGLEAVRSRYGIPPGVPFLLSVARMNPRKNIPRVVRAFRRLLDQERVPGLHLVLAGGFALPREEARRTLAEAGPAGERVVFTGFVAEEDLPALYSAATGFVFVSLLEGFGLPPLEAMRCGTPVLASGVCSLPEVVGDAALVVDPTDEEAIAGGMLALAGDTALRERLRSAGLARAAAFTWERFRRQTLDAARLALE